MRVTHNYASNHVALTLDMYTKAATAAKELRLNNLIDTVSRERNEFKTFCQLNSINI